MEFLTDRTAPEELAPGVILLRATCHPAAWHEGLPAALGVRTAGPPGTAVVTRKAEFLAGRILARDALRALGAKDGEVPVGPSRAPIWPPGFAGSISHSHGHIAVLVGPGDGRRIGLDLERLLSPEVARDVSPRILTDGDRAHLIGEAARATTLVFSAKEALYKAIFPRLGQVLDFDVAELAAPPDRDALTLVLTRDLAPDLRQGQRFTLGHRDLGSHLLTWLIA